MSLWEHLPGLTRQESATPDRKPRILIGIVGFQGVVPEAQESVFSMAYHCGKFMPEYDFFLRVILKREQFRARNHLVEMAQVNECEYLLMLDDDMVIPQDLLQRLMKHKKDITGALYFQRGGAYHPVLMHQASGKDGLKGIDFIHHFDQRLRNPGLHEFDIIGGGCMLFKTEVFEKLPKPYFWIDGIIGTDVHICSTLKTAGYKVWADTSIELGHIGPPQVITSRTVPRYSRKLGEINEELWEDFKGYYHVTDDELQSEMILATFDARAEEWNKEPRNTWEGVKKYYQNVGRTGVMNLGVFNLRYDQGRDWAINESGKILKPGARVVDYGCGLGYLSVALAQKNGYYVYAMDLEGLPTMKFLKWRKQKHNLDGNLIPWTFEEPVPRLDFDKNPVDGVFMISVLEHLWDPYGALEWVTQNVKPGGFLYCDGWHQWEKEDEPQHLCKFDHHKITKQFTKMGWTEAPENPFLYFKNR